MSYSGISAQTMFLLAQNRFENSKIFYEEHKEQLKAGITVPMRQIAGELSPFMYEIDEMMKLDPVRMVSRIRRDTRYTHDKHMYRDNLWVMFMRPKHEWRYHPCMWFEVCQDSFSYGVGTYDVTPALMELYRKALLERSDEFLKAAKSAESIGAAFSAEEYKKPKPGTPSGELQKYYNVKNLFFVKHIRDFKTLESDEIIKQLKEEYKAYAPMYKFLLSISDEYISS